MLTDKATELERNLVSHQEKQTFYQQLESDFAQTKSELELLTGTVSALQEEKDKGDKKIMSLKNIKKELQQEKEHLIDLLADAANAIKEALQVNMLVFIGAHQGGIGSRFPLTKSAISRISFQATTTIFVRIWSV